MVRDSNRCVVLALVAAPFAVACDLGPGDSVTAARGGAWEEAAPAALKATPHEGLLWPGPLVPVCWEATDPDSEKARLIRRYVENSWQRYTRLSFAGWGRCGPREEKHEIRIRSVSSNPYYAGESDVGRQFAAGGAPAPTELRIDLDSGWCHPWPYPFDVAYRETCLKYATLHEFGHALGMLHPNVTGGDALNLKDTPGRDPLSVMGSPLGYSNLPFFLFPALLDWDRTGLSTWDVAGVQKLYGKKPAGSLVAARNGRCAGGFDDDSLGVSSCGGDLAGGRFSQDLFWNGRMKMLNNAGEHRCIVDPSFEATGRQVPGQVLRTADCERAHTWSFRPIRVRGKGANCLVARGSQCGGRVPYTLDGADVVVGSCEIGGCVGSYVVARWALQRTATREGVLQALDPLDTNPRVLYCLDYTDRDRLRLRPCGRSAPQLNQIVWLDTGHQIHTADGACLEFGDGDACEGAGCAVLGEAARVRLCRSGMPGRNREPQEFWFTGKIIGPQLRGISLASPQIQVGLSPMVTATGEYSVPRREVDTSRPWKTPWSWAREDA